MKKDGHAGKLKKNKTKQKKNHLNNTITIKQRNQQTGGYLLSTKKERKKKKKKERKKERKKKRKKEIYMQTRNDVTNANIASFFVALLDAQEKIRGFHCSLLVAQQVEQVQA